MQLNKGLRELAQNEGTESKKKLEGLGIILLALSIYFIIITSSNEKFMRILGEFVFQYHSLNRFIKCLCLLFPREIHYEDVSVWHTVFCKELFRDAKCWGRNRRLQRDLQLYVPNVIIEHHKSSLKPLKVKRFVIINYLLTMETYDGF